MLINVQPARDARREFARWAVAQTPKVRTCSTTAFAVPDHLFAAVPEQLLVGALVDGQPYQPLGAVVLEEREALPGQVLPEAPGSAHPPDAVLLPVEVAHGTPAAQDGPTAQESGLGAFTVALEDVHACVVEGCGRSFASRRALLAHSRQAHPALESDGVS